MCSVGLATLAVAVVAAGVSAYAASEQAGYQADVYKAQAQQAADTNALNKIALEQQRKQALGTQAALYSASGVTLEGSPTDIMSQTSGEYGKAAYNASMGLNFQTNLLNAAAGNTTAQGNLSTVGTLLNFGSKAATTYGSSGGAVTPTSSANTFGGSDYGAALYNPGTNSGVTSPY